MSLIMIFVILLNMILFSNLEISKYEYFSIIDDKEKKFLLIFDNRLPFIPKLLEITAIIEGYTNASLVRILNRGHYFLQKERHSCIDPFIYEIPESILSLLTVNFTISFGKKRMILDEIIVAIKPDFMEREHILDGLLENTRLRVILKHKSPNQTTSMDRYHSNPLLNWSRKLRKLAHGESYCLKLFTKEFSKPLIFSKYPEDGHQPFKYYKFTVTTLGYMIPYQLQKKSYLGNVYPCASSTPSEEILKIYVRPFTKQISFELSESDYGYTNSIQYTKKSGNFTISTKNYNFKFDKLQIISKNLKQDMVDNKNGMLLYPEKIKRKFCREYLPKFLQNYLLSYIEETKVGKVTLKRYFHYVDLSTLELGVYIIRKASTSEMEQCL